MIRAAIMAALVAFTAPHAKAQGGMRISPIALELGERARTTSFRFQNAGETPRAFQIDVMAWSQADGADVLTPARDIIVTPSVFEVQAGRTQIVRAALAPGVAAAQTERTYRLLLREFALEDAPSARGLNLRLEISLPVFVQALAAMEPAVHAQRVGDAISISNTGASHVRLSGVRVGESELSNAPRYLLAGQSFQRRAPGPGAVHARVAHGHGAPIEMTLTDAPAQPLRR